MIKIWSAIGGRLLATLRGHSSEITDLAVNYENTLLVSGSCDKTIRVWCLRSTEPVTILTGHTSAITSVKFCPNLKTNERFLISTSNDGSVKIWKWDAVQYTFDPKVKFIEKNHRANAQMLCSSFSPGGCFLAVGSTDHFIRVYHLMARDGPVKVFETEVHSESVDSILFSNYGLKFISGSKDGTAHIWWFERQVWRKTTLNMSEVLPGATATKDLDGKNKIKVNMVCWTCDDQYVITAVNDFTLKVWEAETGKLRHVLTEHDDEVFVLEANPVDPRIFLSGGHDGKIILWDVHLGKPVAVFCNQIEGQGPGAIFDCKWSPDGLMLASTDAHGHLAIFGYGSFHKRYDIYPDHVFFHTDYRPVIRDANHYVVDEQTQCAPHLMPPPFLVDVDGNPHPPPVQRLVPGRENCNDDQLVPYVAIQNERGIAEVLQPVVPPGQDAPQPQPVAPDNNNQNHLLLPQRPTIDDMIERLARERVNFEHGYAVSQNGSLVIRPQNHSRPASPPPGPSYRDLGLYHGPPNRPQFPQRGYRSEPINSSNQIRVRRPIGNWQSREKLSAATRTIVEPLRDGALEHMRIQFSAACEWEKSFYDRELKKRKLSEIPAAPKVVPAPTTKAQKKRKPTTAHRVNTTRNSAPQLEISNQDIEASEESTGNESDPSFTGSDFDTSSGSSSSFDSDSDVDNNEEQEDGSDDESYRSGELPTRSSSRLASRLRQRKSRRKSWRNEAQEILNKMIAMPDSEPFRAPVDPTEYPDYSTVVSVPMDLGTVMEGLTEGTYPTAQHFANDVMLIFKNSKNYNTDRKSRIYGMTTRLASFFHESAKQMLSNHERRAGRLHRNGEARYTLRNKKHKELLLGHSTNSRRCTRRPKRNKKENSKEASTSQPSSSSSIDPSQPSTSGLSVRPTSQSCKKDVKNRRKNLVPKDEPQANGCEHLNGLLNGNSQSGSSFDYRLLVQEESDDETDVETANCQFINGSDTEKDGNDTDATLIAENEAGIGEETSAAEPSNGSKRRRKNKRGIRPKKRLKVGNGQVKRESVGSGTSSDSNFSQVLPSSSNRSCTQSSSHNGNTTTNNNNNSNTINNKRKRVSSNGLTAKETNGDICPKCTSHFSPEASNNRGLDDWIECEHCNKWFHMYCVKDLLPKNTKRLEKYHFSCPVCSVKRYRK